MNFKDIISTLKTSHYVKNLVVFVPLIFSLNLFNKDLLYNSVLTAIAFCFISSAVYILNDLIDIEKDKLHPIKSKRAIASGKISKKTAILIMTLLILSSIFITCFNYLCQYSILAYFILNIFYSFKLKKFF